MKVLITAGPTQEPIDPVRFISNHSSGKMGIALAEEFAARGHQVVLIKGPTELKSSSLKVKEVPVTTAAQMFDSCAQYFGASDVIVFAAAVADYTPKYPSQTKLKKKEDELYIELVKTKDIAGELGKQKKPEQFLVGFALETDNELAHAQEKLKKKNLDFIVLNSVRDEGAGFKFDTNKVTIIDKNGNTVNFELKSKTEVAKDLVNYVEKMMNK
ncbi:MAG: bifunctional phosphopantothenoylcysteine decarboxylase/phosphopantothenate--cysteine ligase CoaBC [Chitinophagales bacterium]